MSHDRREVEALLRRYRLRGIEATLTDGDVRLRGPREALTQTVADELRTMRPGLETVLERQEETLRLSLSQFSRRRASIEFRLPGHDGTFWLVPTHRDVEILVDRGTPRGRIWTAQEFRGLLDLPRRADAFRDAVGLKLAANGRLVEAVRDIGDETDG